MERVALRQMDYPPHTPPSQAKGRPANRVMRSRAARSVRYNILAPMMITYTDYNALQIEDSRYD